MKKIELYFLLDDYFKRFSDKYLMLNKEEVDNEKHDRPFFYTFKDKKNPKIYWLVPVSSQITKYKRIYKHKLEKYKENYVEDILFGKVISTDAAFLIQNICPATKKYLKPYLNKIGEPIKIKYDLAVKIEKQSNIVLAKSAKDKIAVFPNIKYIYNELEKELEAEKAESILNDVNELLKDNPDNDLTGGQSCTSKDNTSKEL